MMVTFTMLTTTVSDVTPTSSTFFSRGAGKLGRAHGAHPVKMDDVLPVLEHISYVGMSFDVSILSPINSYQRQSSLIEEIPIQPLLSDASPHVQASPLMVHKYVLALLILLKH
jgi:hypothetical protein